MNARCQGVKRDGQPCSLPANGPDGFCWAHSPRNAEQRRRTASRAGKAKPRNGGEIAAIKGRLAELAEDVIRGDVDRSAAAVAGQLYNVYLRAVATELQVKASEDFDVRLAELEALEAQREGGRYGRA